MPVNVGQAILPAAAFQAASCLARIFERPFAVTESLAVDAP
jgi:hypothetical protein